MSKENLQQQKERENDAIQKLKDVNQKLKESAANQVGEA